jgi:response regulator RpfG family c-di-GMP phosphodiesterase
MHYIGKITTPEHIIDKSTKLETIYDRIETVKLKFELLKRDARIAFLEQTISMDDYHKTLAALDEEYAFLSVANQGAEFFSDEKVARIRTIEQSFISIDNNREPILNDDEINNLCVQKGTLTNEQRHIINNHAAVSLRMLNQLPFPQKFARVAEIACGHHEKINGRGYPLGLKGDELSFEARILAIADLQAFPPLIDPIKKRKNSPK